jgi:hypothetical protein
MTDKNGNELLIGDYVLWCKDMRRGAVGKIKSIRNECCIINLFINSETKFAERWKLSSIKKLSDLEIGTLNGR